MDMELGYYNQLKFHQLYFVRGAVWVFQIIFSAIWLRYFLFGPFEWLWRSATYWKKATDEEELKLFYRLNSDFSHSGNWKQLP